MIKATILKRERRRAGHAGRSLTASPRPAGRGPEDPLTLRRSDVMNTTVVTGIALLEDTDLGIVPGDTVTFVRSKDTGQTVAKVNNAELGDPAELKEAGAIAIISHTVEVPDVDGVCGTLGRGYQSLLVGAVRANLMRVLRDALKERHGLKTASMASDTAPDSGLADLADTF